MKSYLGLAVVLALLVPAAGWAQSANTDTAAIEQTLRKLDAEAAAAAAAGNVDNVVSHYAPGAIVMAPNAPAMTTADAIKAGWTEAVAGLSLSWKPNKVEVASAGDLAYVTGTYEDKPKDKGSADRGKYLAVWKKQSDGSWKMVADIWNSDLPQSAAAEKK